MFNSDSITNTITEHCSVMIFSDLCRKMGREFEEDVEPHHILCGIAKTESIHRYHLTYLMYIILNPRTEHDWYMKTGDCLPHFLVHSPRYADYYVLVGGDCSLPSVMKCPSSVPILAALSYGKDHQQLSEEYKDHIPVISWNRTRGIKKVTRKKEPKPEKRSVKRRGESQTLRDITRDLEKRCHSCELDQVSDDCLDIIAIALRSETVLSKKEWKVLQERIAKSAGKNLCELLVKAEDGNAPRTNDALLTLVQMLRFLDWPSYALEVVQKHGVSALIVISPHEDLNRMFAFTARDFIRPNRRTICRHVDRVLSDPARTLKHREQCALPPCDSVPGFRCLGVCRVTRSGAHFGIDCHVARSGAQFGVDRRENLGKLLEKMVENVPSAIARWKLRAHQ